MSKEIHIIHDKSDTNPVMTKLLETTLNMPDYKVVLQTRSEYEDEFIKYDLLRITRENTYFIFLGKTNSTLFDKVKWHYEKFGMKYGWDARQAMLYIENRKLVATELEEFEKLLGEGTDNTTTIGEIKKEIKDFGKKLDKLPLGIKIAGAVGGAAVFGLGAAAIAGSAYLINGKMNKDALYENQQKYLVKIFCEQAFAKFTEGT
jgi:hypothetical protein